MALVDVLPYFRTHLDALGHKEWEDALNFDNIPENILDRVFHLEIGTASVAGTNQGDNLVDVPITVRLFLLGEDDTLEVRDRALEFGDEILESILSFDKLIDSGLTKVLFSDVGIEPKAASNDNSMILILNFTASTVICK